MTEPSWKKLAIAKVAAKPEGLWNMVHPYVRGAALLKVTVVAQVVDQNGQRKDISTKWKTTANDEGGADGVFRPPRAPASFLVPTAPFGALIAKIGGSTADLPDASASGGPYPGRKVFAVGSCTVVTLIDTDCGPLFLTMNDSPAGFADHAGELWVLIEGAPVPPSP